MMRGTRTGRRCTGAWTRNQFLLALLIMTASGTAVFGQDDEVIDDAIAPRPPAVMPVQGVVRVAQFNPEQIDQWIFSRWGGATGARSRLDANLGLRIDDLERACEINPEQQKKLKVAGLGDIKRYYDRVEDLKRKYASDANQSNLNNNIWQEMQPMQIELNNGLFGPDSIFAKTVKNTLNALQVQRHDDLMQQRAAQRRRATIELFVLQLDKALGLAEGERGRLVELLTTETPAPKKYGQADYWYLMYQMTRLPESKLTAILDEPQWRLLKRQFTQARGMEPWLRSNGLVGALDPSPAGAEAPRAVEVRMRNFAFPANNVAPSAVAVPKK